MMIHTKYRDIIVLLLRLILYLLHGIFGSYTDWVNGTLHSGVGGETTSVIMPSGENRFYLDDEKSGELYGEFIGKELVEFTESCFPLSTSADTFIAGLSMGSYGTVATALKCGNLAASSVFPPRSCTIRGRTRTTPRRSSHSAAATTRQFFEYMTR